jgi:hypothetical protein
MIQTMADRMYRRCQLPTMAKRMITLRRFLGFATKTAIANHVGISPLRWGLYKAGARLARGGTSLGAKIPPV